MGEGGRRRRVLLGHLAGVSMVLMKRNREEKKKKKNQLFIFLKGVVNVIKPLLSFPPSSPPLLPSSFHFSLQPSRVVVGYFIA